MATTLKKPVTRILDTYYERNRPVVIRVTQEGVYLKRQGERWSSAVLCPWAAAYSTACKMKAAADAEGKKRKRHLVKRGLL